MLLNKVHWLDDVSCYAHDTISNRTYNLDKLIEFLDGMEYFYPNGDDKEWFLKMADLIDQAMREATEVASMSSEIHNSNFFSEMTFLWWLKDALQQIGEIKVQDKKSNQKPKRKEEHA